jgi:MFS family permease
VTDQVSLLKRPAFLILWATGACYGTVRWLEVLSIGLFTYDQTRSPLIVAGMMVLRMSPMVIFGTLIGTIADRFNRKLLLLFGFAFIGLMGATLATLAAFDALPLWGLGIAVFMSGIFFSADITIRRTLLGEAAGADMGRAMALDSATSNATRMLGPLTGGIVYESLGLQGVYSISAIVCLLVVVLVSRLPTPTRNSSAAHLPFIESIRSALRYVNEHPSIKATLSVTIIINVWAFPVATMVPVIGRDTLDLSAAWVGVLASGEGAGAFLGALVLSWLVRPRYFVRTYVVGSYLFLGAIALFAAMPALAGAWPTLVLGGFGVAGFAAMQPTLIMSSTRHEYRGRVMGLLTVCIGTGPLGILHVGLMAEWFGASNAVYVMGIEGLFVLTWAVFRWPALRQLGLSGSDDPSVKRGVQR